MKIRVRKGAIISLLLNFQNSYALDGSVVSIDDNEIVLKPQCLVTKENIRKNRYIDATSIDQTITVDSNRSEIHVNKKTVIGWYYYKIPSPDSSPNTIFSGYYTHEELDYDKIHYYNEDGICMGDGDFLE